ncbi:MAG TPA: hypothetical protein VHM90_01930, partial [Phycisphaerae bacterium]|nr:hypothetical protein [Phycisphaerae bacterium]
FFLIPGWISNDQGRAYVLDRLNARLHGPRVTIDKWSLSWFSGTDIQNLRVLEPDGTPMLTCPHVLSGLTLWDLLWGNYDLRNTTADKLEMRIQKNTDGTTSLDSFAQGAGDVIRSARGAVQVNNGRLNLVSAKGGQSIQYEDIKAAIVIASPEAPFRVQISGATAAGAPLSLSATFPPTTSLADTRLRNPKSWSLLDDVSFSAEQLPAAMLCDFLAVDPAWVDSFGEKLASVTFSSRNSPTKGVILSELHITGTPRNGSATMLNATLELFPPHEDGRGAAIAAGESKCTAALRFSPPLARLLGRLNPILGEASADPTGLVRLSAQFDLPLDRPSDATAALRLTFPPLTFTPRDGPSLVRQLQFAAGEIPRPAGPPHFAGTADVLRGTLAGGEFSYDNFLVSLARTRINFSGAAGLDGQVNLIAAIATSTSGLGSATTRVAITGNFEAPVATGAR